MILACVYFFIRIAILIKNYAKLRIVATSQKNIIFLNFILKITT